MSAAGVPARVLGRRPTTRRLYASCTALAAAAALLCDFAAAQALPTSSVINVAPNPSVVGERPVTVTVTSTQTPFGTVRFKVDGVDKPAYVVENVTATSVTYRLYDRMTAGDHLVEAVYDGDGIDFLPSAAPAVPASVTKGALALTRAIDHWNVAFGGDTTSLCFETFDYVGADGDATVTFQVDGRDIETRPHFLDNCKFLTWHDYGSVGAHSLVMRYDGNTNYFAALSLPTLITVAPATARPRAAAPFGAPFRTATAVSMDLGPQAGPADVPLPTGQVQFSVGGTLLGPPLALDAVAHASTSVSMTDRTGVTLHARYGGDPFYAPLDFDVAFIRTLPNVGATVTFDPPAPVYGQAIVANITIKPIPGLSETPTGTLKIYPGVVSVTLDAHGAARVQPSVPPHAGFAGVAFSYSGDANYVSYPDNLPFMFTVPVAKAPGLGRILGLAPAFDPPGYARASVSLQAGPPGQGPANGSFRIADADNVFVSVCHGFISDGVGSCVLSLDPRTHRLVARFDSGDVLDSTDLFDVAAGAGAANALPIPANGRAILAVLVAALGVLGGIALRRPATSNQPAR